MYRALYDFTSSEPKTLKLRKGDCFTVIEFADEHWWVAQNGKGEVGFIPRAYIEKDEVAHTEVLKSIDRAIESIHFAASDAGAYTGQQRENLQKLIQHRRAVVENHRNVKDSNLTPSSSTSSSTSSVDGKKTTSTGKEDRNEKRQAPAPPNRTTSTSSNGPTTPKETCRPPELSFTPPPMSQPVQKVQITKVPSQAPAKVANGEIKRAGSPSNPLRASHSPSPVRFVQSAVPNDLGPTLVELVRSNSGLSFDKSQATVCLILERLANSVPSTKHVMQEVTSQIGNNKHEAGDLSSSHDAGRLGVIFDELAKCKDDSQQRSWALHEDEAVILEYLNELLSILTNANPSVCRKIVQGEHYQALDTLLLYYQMETRWTIRMVLLQVFGALCALESKIVTHLLYSVLPLELARDLRTDRMNIHKFCYSTLVLSMLFSSGEPLPFHHYEHLNQDFVTYLLDEGEDPADFSSSEEILDSSVTTILAFNLHFLDAGSNLVMQVLAKKGTVKAFTEKVMALMNSGVDPVHMFDHYDPAPQNSVHKLLSDLFSSKSTANLLYTNDARVLIDILLRNITDLPPGKSRTDYLTLIELMIANSDYSEHQHRRQELERCFHTLLREEGQESDMDQQLVCKILETFPQFFSSP